MKRWMSLLLAALLLTGCLTACGESEKEPELSSELPAVTTAPTTLPAANYIGYVTADVLMVRTGPGTENPAVGSLTFGTGVEILETLAGWCRISYNGADAWISGDYVSRETPSAIATDPTTPASSAPVTTLPGADPTTAPVAMPTDPVKTTNANGYPDSSVPPLEGGLTAAQRAELYEGLDRILSSSGKKAADVYKYVQANKTYRSMAEGESIEAMAYYTLRHKTASCYYFAAFTYLLMKRAGYAVEFVRGLGWQNGTEHCWIMFKESDGWYFMDSLYVRSAKLTEAQCKSIGYKWDPTVHPKAK